MIRLIVATVSIALLAGAAFATPRGPCPKVLGRSFPSLQDGAQRPFCQYGGEVVAVVNTASLCGHTRQYSKLVIAEIERSVSNE